MLSVILLFYVYASGLILLVHRYYHHAFVSLALIFLYLGVLGCWGNSFQFGLFFCFKWILPLYAISMVCHAALIESDTTSMPKKYQAKFQLRNGVLNMKNIRRGVSIIGSAGSGKTESVVFSFLKHFNKYGFCGVIHDYKHFEITEMAYPLFQDPKVPFHIVSFDDIYKRVNPIAPRYMEDEESVNEISRVLLENLLEQKESVASGSSKFFNDAVEGLLGGLIWRLKMAHPDYCTLPHLIATYQYLDTEQLVSFLSSDFTSKAMADAFISGIDSDRQTAGVMSTLANALKKISTPRIFMTLSADEIPLDINNPKHPSVISVVNNPKFDIAYSPVIATIVHTITKQMSVRNRLSSFFLAEEASTFRLLNMQRIPATLRSYDIATVYVLQDKIQNDLMYGDKASKAILSNLSYQFFGKANDPDTAKYYERFFEIIKQPTRSVSKSSNWNFDARITKGEKDVSKIRADVFFRLKRGEFIAFADGKDKRVKFEKPDIKRELPKPVFAQNHPEIRANFQRIHLEVRRLFS
ncbi:type IV secretory system conjugative DNA transfer VirD4/TraG family protein [Flavobacteriaceae bacterium MAR_2009_75]|nr:type IV secretory system conjugative DNA transfer VirD4/TraG family protein [Flavobacteriaceae bacterium MAR_2009_75]